MKFDKIFKEGTKRKDKLMTIILLLLGLVIIVLGLIKRFKTIDPKYFVLIASLVGLLISAFSIGGKLFQDIASSEKQSTILYNSKITVDKTSKTLEKTSDNLTLSQKVVRITEKFNETNVVLDKNITSLKLQSDKIQTLNQQIDSNLFTLKELNTLQLKDLEKQNFPFPKSLFVSFSADFILDTNEVKKLEQPFLRYYYTKSFLENGKHMIYQVRMVFI